jgi:predicted protein tyrosine phosphatase
MLPNIKICSLADAREADLSIYDGVITIEDSAIENPLRVENSPSDQLVLKFDDISVPMDGCIEPNESHIARALSFADKIGDGSLLIHCHAGISRSSAIALAIIAKCLGPGNEKNLYRSSRKLIPRRGPINP